MAMVFANIYAYIAASFEVICISYDESRILMVFLHDTAESDMDIRIPIFMTISMNIIFSLDK